MQPQMDADQRRYAHADLTQRVIGVFFEVYNELGAGFLESVYESAMCVALTQAGIAAQRQAPVSVRFRGQVVEDFRCDLLIEGKVLVELKAVAALNAVHEAQVLNYLRASDVEIGLLLNFGSTPQIKRLAYANARKSPPRDIRSTPLE